MASKTTYIIGVLTLVLLASGVIYISMGDNVRLRVDDYGSTFYVKNALNMWIVSGREYNRLFNGNTLQYRNVSSIKVDTYVRDNFIRLPNYKTITKTYTNGSDYQYKELDGYSEEKVSQTVIITRNTGYQNGAWIVDTYEFNGALDDVELFPISHKVEVINAKGLFYRYTVDELKDTGVKRKLDGELELSFGLDMKVTLHPDYRWAWIGLYYGNDSLSAQYDVKSDYEVFNVRFFDPVVGELDSIIFIPNLDDVGNTDAACHLGTDNDGANKYAPAQNFTLTGTREIWNVSWHCAGFPVVPDAEMYLTVETDNNGAPSRTLAHANANVTFLNAVVSCNAGDAGWNNLTFTPFTLTAGTYWLRFDHIVITGAPSREYYLGLATNRYDGHTLLSSVNDGAWTAPVDPLDDMAFMIWGAAVAGVEMELIVDGYAENVSAELGSIINVTANASASDYMCINVDHHEYGNNYSCGLGAASFDLNVSYFYQDEYVLWNDSSYCYQETANETSDCGGLATGSYNLSGSTYEDPQYMWDGDWDTYGYNSLALSTEYFYINYTIPPGTTGAVWQYKSDAQTTDLYSCWNGTDWSEQVELINLANVSVNATCLSSTILQLNITQPALRFFYEEGVFWDSGLLVANVTMDNRSNISLVQLNVSATNEVKDISISYYGDSKVFNGNLSGNRLIDYELLHGEVLSDEANLTYLIAGDNIIYYNITGFPDTLDFELWGTGLDVENEFSWDDKFNDTEYILNYTTTAVYPMWVWDNFTTDGKTIINTSSIGNGYSEINVSPYQRVYSNSSSYIVFNQEVGVSDTDSATWVTLYQNISRFQKIEFQAYCYLITDVGCYYAGVGAVAECTFAISNSPELVSYESVGSDSISSSCSSLSYTADTDTGGLTERVITLERVEDSGTAVTYKVYHDGVYQKTTGVLSGNINLGYKGATTTSGNGLHGNGHGTAEQHGWMNYITYSGVASNYTDAGNYTTNSTVASQTLFSAPSDISAATLTATEYKPSGCSITYYLSNDNSTTFEKVYSGVRHAFDSAEGNLTWMADLNCTGQLGAYGAEDTAAVIDVNIEIVSGIVENVSIDAGNNGIIDFYFNDTINSSTSPINFSFNFSGSEGTGSYPVSITAYSPGELRVNASVLNSSINPVTLTASEFENCTACQIEFGYEGIDLVIDDLFFQYVGGNDTVLLTAYDDSYLYNKSLLLTYFYSGWSYEMPRYVDYLEFIPRSSTAQNVTPYGQNSNVPIFNITMDNYDTYGANFSIHLNETNSCVNLTASPTHNKSQGFQLGINWTTLFTDKLVDEWNGIWLWADYGCNFSNWTFWDPELSFRACCAGCEICDNSTG